MESRDYDLIIVGGGITGAAVLYAVSAYTNISRVLLIEKYEDIATLNSNSRSNSQTLHFGDVETNYTLKKATEAKMEANRVLRYIHLLEKGEQARIISKCQKMVLGVGDEEVESLEKTYYSGIKRIFPGLKKVEREGLSGIEPNTVRGRPAEERIVALVSDSGYMVDFERLARSFVSRALRNKKARINLMFNTAVKSLREVRKEYVLTTTKGEFRTKFVVFATGSYSLLFAKMLDFDKNLSIISIGGDYFISKRMLNGKVYRVQKGGVPFAAVHADPDIRNPDITRYGPTATMPLRLEKRGSTFFDYLRSFNYDIKTLETLVKVVSNEDIIRILETNFVYGLPLIGKRWFFENEARKIVPTIKYEQLYHERGMGGIRPQIVDENTESFFVGASKLYDNNAIFNITPSPGASSSLESGIEDMKYIARALGLRIDHKKFEAELGIG